MISIAIVADAHPYAYRYMHTMNFIQGVLATLALCAVLSSCATLTSRTETRTETFDSSAKSVAASADTGDYWFQLANAYAEEERLEEAENAYKKALKRGKGAKALHNLGLVQVWLGIKALREARTQLPPDDPVHLETRRYLNALLQGP